MNCKGKLEEYMKFIDLIEKTLTNHNSLLLLDIDDTLLKAKGIFIHRISDKKELTPAQFALETMKKDFDHNNYDFKEFRNKTKVKASILDSKPIIANLRMMDNYIKNGWDIGLLTARGMENTIAETMKLWLMYKNSEGKLESIGDKLPRDRVFAISDEIKNYKGDSVDEKKANVIKKLAKEYTRIMFVDDDKSNIKKVKAMVEKERSHGSSKLNKVYTKVAKKE